MSCSLKNEIILGIDPGSRITGYGIIESDLSNKLSVIDFGCIRPPYNLSIEYRYLIIFESIFELINKFKPTAVATETQFVKKNIQSAIKLGMARGAVLIAAAKQNIPIYEYAPRKAKLAVVGNGQASKYQVQKMTQFLLNLPKIPSPEDAADALALAICHINNINFINITKRC